MMTLCALVTFMRSYMLSLTAGLVIPVGIHWYTHLAVCYNRIDEVGRKCNESQEESSV